jgi:hypothetical protein
MLRVSLSRRLAAVGSATSHWRKVVLAASTSLIGIRSARPDLPKRSKIIAAHGLVRALNKRLSAPGPRQCNRCRHAAEYQPRRRPCIYCAAILGGRRVYQPLWTPVLLAARRLNPTCPWSGDGCVSDLHRRRTATSGNGQCLRPGYQSPERGQS